jgi:hypothetical protein
MKIQENYFENYFEHQQKYSPELLNWFLQDKLLSDKSKSLITDDVKFIYKISDKKVPDVTWLTLDEVKSQFINDEVEIITTFGNKNWVDFHISFIEFISHKEDVNKSVIDVHKKNIQSTHVLSDIMNKIFGFIDLGSEIILIEKPLNLIKFDNEGKLHSISGPAIHIGDLREYFINGVNVTPKGWSKRLRIALIDVDDTLLNNLSDETLREIRNEIKTIDGDDIKNINEPTVLVFYLDRELFASPEIINGFSESVNTVFEQRHFNAIAFFMPTDTEERIEAINPQLVNEDEYKKVISTLETCKKLFDMDNKKIIMGE